MPNDFYVDAFDTIDGKNVCYAEQNPRLKFEVVSLLDIDGAEVNDVEEAVGGVVKLAEERFQIFTFPNCPSNIRTALNERVH